MKTARWILFLGLSLVLLYLRHAAPAGASEPEALTPGSASRDRSATETSVPAKVLQVLQVVRTTGHPPDGYVGGRTFENRERRLPADGDYREFDVDPHVGGRNAERIIVEWKTKKAWYTADHYQTFIPLP